MEDREKELMDCCEEQKARIIKLNELIDSKDRQIGLLERIAEIRLETNSMLKKAFTVMSVLCIFVMILHTISTIYNSTEKVPIEIHRQLALYCANVNQENDVINQQLTNCYDDSVLEQLVCESKLEGCGCGQSR